MRDYPQEEVLPFGGIVALSKCQEVEVSKLLFCKLFFKVLVKLCLTKSAIKILHKTSYEVLIGFLLSSLFSENARRKLIQ